MKRRPRQSKKSGFALLFVFAMAAIVAISLYSVLPIISFEAQRDKEELLIERGGQYKRAIGLYVRKFKRYPAKMEDLDSANGQRFLRHHYTDPMTGKDEWRLIHAGPGGILLDSLIKKDTDKDKKQTGPTSISELLGVGSVPETDPAATPGLRKRPSDQQSAPGTVAGTTPPNTPIPNDTPGPKLTGTLAGPTPPGGTLPDRLPPTNAAGSAVNSQTGGISGGMGIGATAAQVPPIVNQQIQNPAAPGLAPAGATPNAQGANQAAALIQGLLTTPRPGGLAGLQNPTAAGNQTIGGGIAGIASTIKSGTGIKVYNDQEEYKKWEFIYDAAKEAQAAGAGVPAQGAVPGTPIGQPGLNGTPAPGTPISGGFGSLGSPVTPPK